MAVATLSWTLIDCPPSTYWCPTAGHGTPSGVPTSLAGEVALPNGFASFALMTSGDWQAGTLAAPLTGTFSAGSLTISNVSDTTELAAGQLLTGVSSGSSPAYQTAPFPLAQTTIASVSGSTVTFTNAPGGVPAPGPVGAVASGTFGFVVTDPIPAGYLSATITPTTGLSVLDPDPDGQDLSNHVGNGAHICSWENQAAGSFKLAFAAAGTYTIDAEFSASAAYYSDVAVSPTLSLTVT